MSESNEYNDFFSAYSNRIKPPPRNLNNVSNAQNIYDFLTNYPMIFSQAHYVLDYPTLTITYQKGIKELLGYDENEFNYNLLSNYFHPDDRKRYTFIVKAVVEYFENNPAKLFGAEFAITVRLRKKDGSYLHSLRQSTIIETNSENIMTKSFSILSDISHIKRNNYVDWNCTSHGRHVSDLRKHIENKHKNYFTKREMEILNYLQLGKKSKEIGEKLYVSKHTVDTHRRKMLAKSTCSNTVELLGFARKNAII